MDVQPSMYFLNPPWVSPFLCQVTEKGAEESLA